MTSPELDNVQKNKPELFFFSTEEAVAKVRIAILDYEQDFIAAGGTHELIELAILKAEERIKRELEEREKQEPLRVIEAALLESATTDDEIQIARKMKDIIEQKRSEWKEAIKNAQEKYKQQGTQNVSLEQLIDSPGRPVYLSIHKRLYEDDQVAYYVLFPILYPCITTEVGPVIPSLEFENRLLQNLSVLGKNSSIDYLRRLRKMPGSGKYPKGPYYQPREEITYPNTPRLNTTKYREHASHLPTSMPGVDVYVTIERPPYIDAALDLKAFQKALAAPKS